MPHDNKESKMRVSPPVSDDQPLMRYLTHDKFLRLLNPQPALEVWSFLDPPRKGRETWKASTPLEYGSLWMALPQAFKKDPDEGTFPALNASDESFSNAAARPLRLSAEEAEQRKKRSLAQNPPALRAAIRARTQLCGVTCWYQDSAESACMWREYVPAWQGRHYQDHTQTV